MKWLRKLLFPKLMPIKEHKRIVRTLREEIERKKQEIKKLHEEKELVLRTSIKQETRNQELRKRFDSIHRSKEEDIEKKEKGYDGN